MTFFADFEISDQVKRAIKDMALKSLHQFKKKQYLRF